MQRFLAARDVIAVDGGREPLHRPRCLIERARLEVFAELELRLRTATVTTEHDSGVGSGGSSRSAATSATGAAHCAGSSAASRCGVATCLPA